MMILFWNTGLMSRYLWHCKSTDLIVEHITNGIPLGDGCRVGGRPSSPGKAFAWALLTWTLHSPHIHLILFLFCFLRRLVTGILGCGWVPFRLSGSEGRGAGIGFLRNPGPRTFHHWSLLHFGCRYLWFPPLLGSGPRQSRFRSIFIVFVLPFGGCLGFGRLSRLGIIITLGIGGLSLSSSLFLAISFSPSSALSLTLSFALGLTVCGFCCFIRFTFSLILGWPES